MTGSTLPRAAGFRETLKSDIDVGRFQPPGEQSPNMNLVIVSHGLTLRVFLMRWYKWTVKQFEGLHNMNNGSIVVMERGYGGRYILSIIPSVWKVEYNILIRDWVILVYDIVYCSMQFQN